MASNALTPTPLQTDAEQVLVALDEAREATIALVAALDEERLATGALTDHEPARLGSRPHRRL